MGLVFTEETWVEFNDFPYLKEFNDNVNGIFQTIGGLLGQEINNVVSNQIFDLTTELWKLLRCQKKYVDSLNECIGKINTFINDSSNTLILGKTNIYLEEHLSNYIGRYYKIVDFKLTKILNNIYGTHFEPRDFRKILVRNFGKEHHVVKNFDIYKKEWLSPFKETRKQYTHNTKQNDDLYIFEGLKLYTDRSICYPEVNFGNKKVSIQEFMKINTTHLIHFSEDIIVSSLESLILKLGAKIYLSADKEINGKYEVRFSKNIH